jgi:cell division septum initiation protein DivIVA
MKTLELVYNNIEVEEMFEIVTDLICAEYHRLEVEGEIEPCPPIVNPVSGVIFKEPRHTLSKFAERKLELLTARRTERETRERYTKKLTKKMQDALEKTRNVPIRHYADGEPDVDEYKTVVADEVAEILRENESLLQRLGEREDEIKHLRIERIISLKNAIEDTTIKTSNKTKLNTNKPVKLFREFVKDSKRTEEIIGKLHRLIGNKTNTDAIRIITKAMWIGWLTKPTATSIKQEFPTIKCADQQISKCLTEKAPTHAGMIEKIKTEFEQAK